MNDAIDLALCLVWYASFDAAVDVWSENLAKQPYLPNVTLNQSFAHSGFWSPWFCIWRWIIFWKGSANGVLQFLWYVQVFQYFPSVVCILQSIWSECYTLSRQFSFLLGRRVRRVMWCCYSISWTCRRSWAYLWLMKKKRSPVTTLTIGGIELNTVLAVSRLLGGKWQHLQEAIWVCWAKKKVTFRELQVLLNHLNFAWKVVVAGRVFCHQLYIVTAGVKSLIIIFDWAQN